MVSFCLPPCVVHLLLIIIAGTLGCVLPTRSEALCTSAALTHSGLSRIGRVMSYYVYDKEREKQTILSACFGYLHAFRISHCLWYCFSFKYDQNYLKLLWFSQLWSHLEHLFLEVRSWTWSVGQHKSVSQRISCYCSDSISPDWFISLFVEHKFIRLEFLTTIK